MNRVFLTDREIKDNLFPLTLTRSAADIRVGILTIREKWKQYLNVEPSTADDLPTTPEDALILSANIIPSKKFTETLFEDPDWSSVKIIQYPWHIFLWNDWAIREDFTQLTQNKSSAPIPPTVQTVNPENIFIEEGAVLRHCVINAETGPVYIGKHAQVMEGTLIRGPVAICEHAVVKMGTKIYGATTIGPYCIAGGEIKNAVLSAYSNKAHDGYLGDSVIGEWCNIGAGTSNSNVKNNASEIKMWSNAQKEMISAGLNKCGLIMGDYSRAAINTSFNTGTIVGVCANVYGDGLTPKYIPSFAWGSKNITKYDFDKAIADIEKWKNLKNRQLSAQEKTRLKLIFDQI